MLGWMFVGIWCAALAAFPLKFHWRIGYLNALARCFAAAAFLGVCLFVNYRIADALELSKGSSGYVRGKSVISPYGFVVQLLTFAEVGAAWWLLRKKPNS